MSKSSVPHRGRGRSRVKGSGVFFHVGVVVCFTWRNRFLARAGIAWADAYLERTTASGFAVADISPLVHFGQALDALIEQRRDRRKRDAKELAQAGLTIEQTIRTLPQGPNAIMAALRPTSELARKSIADLPAWMPEEFPPKR
jgi:hypothetical protein